MTLQFKELGPGLELVEDGRGVSKTVMARSAFALAVPVLRSGTASATFKRDDRWKVSSSASTSYTFQIGVFPANQKLDSSIYSADGKRCALYVQSFDGGRAQVLCDGEYSDFIQNIGLQRGVLGDAVEVRVAFEDATTARVTFHSSRVDLATLGRTLEGVPACGLRLYREDTSVTLLASSVDAGAAGEVPFSHLQEIKIETEKPPKGGCGCVLQ